MATGTTFRPRHENDFNSDAMQMNILSTQGLVNPSESKNIDLTLTDDCLLQGVEKLLVYNGDKNDVINLQVVHPIYGVINQFCTNFFIDSAKTDQLLSRPSYVAKLPAGLTIRVQYIASAALGQRDVKVNWLLHKVLV